MKNPKKWTALNEYKRSADGDYVYTGGYYAPVDAAAYGKRCRVFVLCGACVAALVVAQGLLTAGGMKNTFYVLLPFLGEVICLFLAVWNTVRLLYAGDRIKRYVYESVTKTIPGALLALCVFAAAAFIGSVVFLVLNGAGEELPASVVQLALELLASVTAFLLRRYFLRLQWQAV